MTRQEKYPDTKTFHYYNANPKNRITGDCAFRAIATALNQDYNTTVMEMAEAMCKSGYALNDTKGIDFYLRTKGWKKCSQPRKSNGMKYTGAEWSGVFNGTCVANIGAHHIVCIKENKVWDIWNSTDRCVGNYWIKIK